MNGTSRRFALRFSVGVSGQAFARIANVLSTILLVPVLIRGWGVDGYGQWIAITALASYLGYSNFGLVTTSANEVIMAVGANNLAGAQRTFQMALNSLVLLVLPAILAVAGASWFAPVARILNLTQITPIMATAILILQGVQIFSISTRGVMAAALYATGSYGLAYFVAGSAKLTELCITIIAVTLFKANQLVAAEVVTAVALVDLTVVSVLARDSASWARMDLRRLDWKWIGEQLRPSVGFLLATVATQGILVQGTRVVLGALLGGSAVAVYAVYGTAMRLVDQLLLTVALPLEVEMAHSVGRGELAKTAKLITLGTQISWGIYTGVAALLLAFGPFIFVVWTHGRITFSYTLMGLFLVMSACNQAGRISSHALISTNRLFGPSFLMFAGSMCALALGAALVPIYHLEGSILGAICGEAANSAVVLVTVSLWLGQPLKQLLREVTDLSSLVHYTRSSLQKVLAALIARGRSRAKQTRT
jgi:O-antigen/teichoic acid export membrane protein